MKNKTVCLVGCGGIGGYAAEYLMRLGVGNIIAVDGDRFTQSNMNRQLYCLSETIGQFKAEAVKQRCESINPLIRVTAHNCYLTQENAAGIISDADVVIDALDNMQSRQILAHACSASGKVMIHGAIGTGSLQVAVIPPGKKLPCTHARSVHAEEVLSYVPAMCASYEVSECHKLLLGQKGALYGKMLCIDLDTNEHISFEI